MKDDRLYLVYISECIDRIDTYTAKGKVAFLNDLKTQVEQDLPDLKHTITSMLDDRNQESEG